VLKIHTKAVFNPFYLYSISNIFVLVVYNFNWSNLLPALNYELKLFLYISSLVMVVLGYVSGFLKLIPHYRSISVTHNSHRVFYFLIAIGLVELINNGGIPLLMLGGRNYDYMQFGIKTIHPIYFTFLSFYTVYLFYLYLSTKNKSILYQLFLLALYPILIMNRGAFLINGTAMLLVYLISIRTIKINNIILLPLILSIFMFLFGMAGDLRSGGTNVLVSYFEPSDTFIKSHIPYEFLWPYIYITSPLGNLQETINNGIASNVYYDLLILQSFVPDFISKHIEFQGNSLSRIAPFLSVGGVYSLAYVNMGWFGILTMFLFVTVFVLLFLVFLPRNTPYTIPGIAIVSTLVIYNIFDNMIVFSGLSVQLLYPLIMGFLYKHKIRL